MTVLKAQRVRVVDAERLARVDAVAEAAAVQREADHRAEVEAAWRAGFDEGRRQAEADGIAAVPRLTDTIGRAAAAVWESSNRRLADDVATTTAVALAVARWLAGRELADHADLVAERIQAALADLLPTGRLTVFVAPAQVDAVREWLADAGTDADVVADKGLEPGEARLDAGDASADLTFDVALARAGALLETAR